MNWIGHIVGVLCALVCFICSASAATLETVDIDGGGLRIAPAPDQEAGMHGLVRFHSDGTRDASYGVAGVANFTLGSDDSPAVSLRVDQQGRAWIGGAIQGEQGMQGVVLRLSYSGQMDPNFAEQGRLVMSSSGVQTWVTDVLPLPDGTALVLGAVALVNGEQKVGVWRISETGSLDYRFGVSGVWLPPDAGDSDVAGVEYSPDGGTAVVVRSACDETAYLEVWTLAPTGERLERGERIEEELTSVLNLTLRWRGGRWQWGAEANEMDAGSSFRGPRSEEPPAEPTRVTSSLVGAEVHMRKSAAAADGESKVVAKFWYIIPLILILGSSAIALRGSKLRT